MLLLCPADVVTTVKTTHAPRSTRMLRITVVVGVLPPAAAVGIQAWFCPQKKKDRDSHRKMSNVQYEIIIFTTIKTDINDKYLLPKKKIITDMRDKLHYFFICIFLRPSLMRDERREGS